MRYLTVTVFAISAFWAASSGALAAQLVMFEQDHCPWCERWHEEIGAIYAKTKEGQRAPLRTVDIHAPLPDDLSHLKLGRFTPTFILLTDDGTEVDRIRGYPGDDFFWGLLGKMLEKLPDSEVREDAEGAALTQQGDQK